jgi:hypothetical protein
VARMEHIRAFTPVFDRLCGMRERPSRISQALHPDYRLRPIFQSAAARHRRLLVNNKRGNKSIPLRLLGFDLLKRNNGNEQGLDPANFLVRDASRGSLISGHESPLAPVEIARLEQQGSRRKQQQQRAGAPIKKSTAGTTGIDSHFVSFNFPNTPIRRRVSNIHSSVPANSARSPVKSKRAAALVTVRGGS